MTLQEIAERHGTDKAQHGYMEHYENALKELFLSPEWDIDNRIFAPFELLEIGCEKGNSIRMWQDIFSAVNITSVDLFMEHPVPDIPGVEFITGNQLDHELLYNLRNHRRFDLIIDDGSHNSRDQLVTFWSLVGTSRLYVVEDLHCCNDELYRQGLPFEKTMLGQMQNGSFPFVHHLYDNKIAFIYAD